MSSFKCLIILCFFLPSFASAKDWELLKSVPCTDNQYDLGSATELCKSNSDVLKEEKEKIEEATLKLPKNQCSEALQSAMRCCLDPTWEECNYSDKHFDELELPQTGGGLIQEFDAQIDHYVNGFNDLRRKAYVCAVARYSSCSTKCGEYIAQVKKDPSNNQLQDEMRKTLAYRDKVCPEFETHISCMDLQSATYKNSAAQSLSCSRSIRSGSGNSAQIYCYKNSKNFEQCQYTESPNQIYKDVSDPSSIDSDLEHTYGVLEVDHGGGDVSICSGTAVGDGSQVLTADHCVSPDGNFLFHVPDENGSIQAIPGYCERNPYPRVDRDSTFDTSICELSSRAKIDKNYFVVTRDVQVKSGCIPQDYFLRCSQDVFLSIDKLPAASIGFPASQMKNGALSAIQSRGTIYYDKDRDQFMSPDLFADGGTSGAGYIAKLEGYDVVLTNHSMAWQASHQIQMPVIGWDEVASMRAELNRKKLEGAEGIFAFDEQ